MLFDSIISKLSPREESSSLIFAISVPSLFLKLNTISYLNFNSSAVSDEKTGKATSALDAGSIPFKFSIQASKIFKNPRAPASTTLFSFKT